MYSYPREYFYKKIVAAKRYIDQHYAETIDVENIATEACFSKFDFIRQFKNTYGRTPYNYLKKVRLDMAVLLLETTEIPVKNIGFCVGYESYSSFSSLFKKAFGQSPRQFKNAHKTKIQSIKSRPLKHVPGCFADNQGWKKSNFEEVS